MQDHFTTLTSQSQDAMTGALRTWAESMQGMFGVPGTPAPDLITFVDITFDFAEKVLATQREITKAILRALTP